MKKSVKVQKIDLDTVGCGFLLGITREDETQVLRGDASEADLANPEVVCIEVGGSGRVSENNWDHHDPNGPQKSASYQAWEALGRPERYARLVEYIEILDIQGPRALPEWKKSDEGVERRFLSDVLAGLFLVERNPVEQFYKGIEILREIVEKGYDPFGEIPGFDLYVEAKAENNRQVAETIKNACFEVTRGGLKIAFLESKFQGAVGALYGIGAQVAVVLNPNFNGVRKFTVAGNGIRVDAITPILNQLEAGWGGPATGTILGSPREGSKLSLEEVARIVRDNL